MNLKKDEVIISVDYDETFIKENTGIIIVMEAIKYNPINFLRNSPRILDNMLRYKHSSALAPALEGFPYGKIKRIMEKTTINQPVLEGIIEHCINKGLKTEKGLFGLDRISTDNDKDAVYYSLLLKKDELKRFGIYFKNIFNAVYGSIFGKKSYKKEYIYDGSVIPLDKRKMLTDNPNMYHFEDKRGSIMCGDLPNFVEITRYPKGLYT